jgi:plastocyanin
MRYPFSRTATHPLHACAAAALLVCAALAISAIHAAAAAPAPSVELDIAKFAFAPKEITIAPGTRVIWTNRDEAPHTIASNDKTFSSKGLDTDDKFEHVFASEGDFSYICTVHPFMTGAVHVRKQ